MTDLQDRQADQVARSFAPQAAKYVTSLVHAHGPDLDQLAAALAAHRPARLLDIGTGGGHAAYVAAAHAGHVTATDLLAEMLAAVTAEAARRGITNLATLQAPAERLPLPDAEFDAVITRFSAHHWTDLHAGLREAGRVCRPGGAGIFLDAASPLGVPSSAGGLGTAAMDSFLQAIELLRDPSHARDYCEAEWRAGLTAAGFTLTALTWRRLRMDFPVWTARMATPAPAQAAIRALQDGASAPVRAHFALEPDGSFLLDTIAIEATRD